MDVIARRLDGTDEWFYDVDYVEFDDPAVTTDMREGTVRELSLSREVYAAFIVEDSD